MFLQNNMTVCCHLIYFVQCTKKGFLLFTVRNCLKQEFDKQIILNFLFMYHLRESEVLLLYFNIS